MNRLLQLASVNARVAGLALRGRWMGARQIACSYDRIAPTYDDAWQCHLRSATDRLLERLPAGLQGTILDLGSGTGYGAKHSARTCPAATVFAIDISGEMLARARVDAPPNLRCVIADMLEFVNSWHGAPPSMILSTWALGYSRPPRLIRACGRIMPPGGVFAFIVNYRGTLEPVFHAFQACMFEFPNRIRLAAIPRFPANWDCLQESLAAAGFRVQFHQDGECHIDPPDGPLLPWLRQTGILAGFDQMLDLSGPAADFFERQLEPHRASIFHHYALAIATKL